MTDTCFHCDEQIPAGCDLTVLHQHVAQPVCCLGCQAVARLIVDGGHDAYYRFRETKARRMDVRDLEHPEHWQAFDQHAITNARGEASAPILVEGMQCGACAWLIETRLGQHDGVVNIDIDLPSGTVTLHWHPQSTRLSDVLIELTQLGFRPHPLDATQIHRAHRRELNSLLRRLAVSGLGMMQVMMFAVATYANADGGMDPAIERLLHGVSMLISAPVVFYAGAPFLVGAWRGLRARALTMDVPIALALLLAFATSCVNFLRADGQTYFESVSMFVFFLLCARWVATVVRHRSLDARLALAPLLPDVALRVEGDEMQPVPRRSLRVGDLVVVRAGDALPGDGVVERGESTLNEALLSGEALPCPRAGGDRVLAGSINLDATLHVRLTDVDAHCAVARMAQNLDQTRAQRPGAQNPSGQLATRFIQIMLSIAVLVGAVWWQIDATRALEVVLAVLVVTCPCALSLAIPTALSAAAVRLARRGILVHRLDALESLGRVDTALFDKTGTLTDGQFGIGTKWVNAAHPSPVDEAELERLVATVEQFSSHPMASAFRTSAKATDANDVEVIAGRGVCGRVEGRRLRIGSAEFAGVEPGRDPTSYSVIYVQDDEGLLGTIQLGDDWREDAAWVISELACMDMRRMVISGDGPERVSSAIERLGLDGGFARCLPEQKLAVVRDLQHAGHVTMAIGDGVNDAAFLAGADVSIALAEGADMARAAADIVVTGQHLQPLLDLLSVARDVPRTIRQNLSWAIGYNLIAVPLAASGLVGPGLAALGMSLSSIIVVLNSARSARAPLRRSRGAPLPADHRLSESAA